MIKLKEIRKAKKINQKEFAAYMNVAQNTVSRWETGERLMDSESIVKAAAYFGVSTDYLLGYAVEMAAPVKVNTAQSRLLNNFKKLNDFGKKEALKRVSELTCLPNYIDSGIMPIAAHTDKTPDDKELDLMRQDIDEL